MTKIRVLIADDHAILRAGLDMLLRAQPDIEVVGEAVDGAEVLQKVAALQPDAVTLDLSMPGSNGIQVIERLRRHWPTTRVLVLTMHDDPTYLRAARAAGAAGYVVKTAGSAELLAALRAVHDGERFLDVQLGESPLPAVLPDRAIDNLSETEAPAQLLSQRERAVLELVAHGYTNQQAADRLVLSIKTVETYRARIAKKLGLRTRADLVRYAVEIGILGPGKVH